MQRSLSEVHGSVAVPRHPSFWRRLFAFVGPAYLVSVGYMDPGNWATDIAGGSRFGYTLLWVLAMSNLMAVLLQSFSTRLGIAAGMDLAQACRALYGRRVSFALWILAELAIAATDLAELLGSAIGLQLLFGLPLVAGVLLTGLDAFLLLFLHSLGMRVMEAFIVLLVVTIGVCLGVEVLLARPQFGELAAGLVPRLPPGSLYFATGILGATVMPHNLYLHSALVQSRRVVETPAGLRAGLRFNLIDSVVALNGAFLVNSALLVVAAAAFHRAGMHAVTEIQDAHRLLEPLLGGRIAPFAFAIALIASGQSSTITGTLAGQIVMEGFVQMRLRPLVRRLITRSVAIIPALMTILFLGEHATGQLLVLSQVVLSLQLAFAVVPLVHLVSARRLGAYAAPRWTQLCGWIVAGVIVFLNLRLALESIADWAERAGSLRWLVWAAAAPGAGGLLALLGRVTIEPLRHRPGAALVEPFGVHGRPAFPEVRPAPPPRCIGVALDFSSADGAVLSHALSQARAAGRNTQLLLMHVVESGAARVLGEEQQDKEARSDEERISLYCDELINLGVDAQSVLGYGDPVEELARLIEGNSPELVVMGGHGHGLVGDIVHGTTVDRLRHRTRVPLLVVPAEQASSLAEKEKEVS